MGLGLDQPSHWLIIALVALVLFGYKKLPEMARSAGRSMRIFKTELKGMADDDDARSKTDGEPLADTVAADAVAEAKAAELHEAEKKAAALRAELDAAELKAAELKAAGGVKADGVIPRAS